MVARVVGKFEFGGACVVAQAGQERAISPGEFILGEKSETGAPLGMPEPGPLGRNGSFVVLRKYMSRVGLSTTI